MPRKNLYIFITAFIALLLLSSVYTVHEGEKALVLRLGRIIERSNGQPLIEGPGLHFKMPIISQVLYMDLRLQTLDIKESRIMTKMKKEVLVDYYVKWRINNLPMYYKVTNGDITRAEGLLEQKLNGALRAEFGKRDIAEVVSGERSDVMAILLKQANKDVNNVGVEVIDVRIKRIDLPATVSQSVYTRMRAEREQVANQQRAEGRALGEAIRANADRVAIETRAKASSEGMRIRGDGDAQAAKIYSEAFNKDPDFYSFFRSLEAYRDSFKSKKDILVLNPNGEFFKYFNNSAAGNAPAH